MYNKVRELHALCFLRRGKMSENRGTKSTRFPIYYNSPVILSFALVALIIFVVNDRTNMDIISKYFCVYRSSFSLGWVVRLFGHVLGHASWNHYINNMMLLLLVGPMLEEKYGSKALLEMILITAAFTGLCNIFLFKTALLGASGIVFMMIVLSSVTHVRNRQLPMTLIVVVLLYLGEQVYDGAFKQDNISQLTHIVGGLLGGIYGLLLAGDHGK